MRRLLVPIMLTFLVLVLVLVIAVAVFSAVTDSKTRVQSLSAVASSVSAMVAAIVALWVAWREFDNRERARLESAQNEITRRRRTAALLGGHIISWADRKDMMDLLDELSHIQPKSFIEDYLKLAVIAKSSPKRRGEPDPPIYWLAEIISVAKATRLAAFESLTGIPNVWSMLAKGEWKGDLPGIDFDYFAVMDTIWANFEMKSRKLRRSFLTLQNFRKGEGDLVQILVSVLIDEVTDLRDSV